MDFISLDAALAAPADRVTVNSDWHNPDAWIEIPEFGVKPLEVNFEGFACPIFGPKVDHALAENIVSLIGMARTLAQREFKTLSGLRASNTAAYDVMLEDQDANPEQEVDISPERLTETQRAGLLYQFFMFDIEIVTRSSASPKKRLEAMASAASSLAMWATGGAAAAHKRLSKRNAMNASALRPNGRVIDPKEVLDEFRRLVRDGHTAREARGLLTQRGNMGSQSTIYRITAKK